MAVNIEFREIKVGPAVNFRGDINYNFSLINQSLNDMGQSVEGVNNKIKEIDKEIDGINTSIKNINTQLVGGVGIDIKLSKTQPTGQKMGDYWFKIL